MDKEILYRLFAGTATDSERARVRGWVEQDPANRNIYMAERRFFDLATMLGNDDGADASTQTTATIRPRRWNWLGYIAAAVALVAVTFGITRHVLVTPPQPMPMLSLTVPPGQRLNLVLADGTDVWLNSGTTLRYPGAFTGADQRLVSVDGEACFSVAHDSIHPFVVTTPRGSITVTGTRFNVDAYSTAKDFAIELMEGGVRFDATAGRSITLEPGERLWLDKNGRMRIDEADASSMEWIPGIVSFKNLPLDQIFDKFEKYYGVHINCPDSLMPQSELFSGKFYIEDGVDHALDVLRRDIDFTYTNDRDTRTVSVK